MVLVLNWWVWKSSHSSQIALSERSICQVHSWQWWSSRCTLNFYTAGARTGGAALCQGLFEHPRAVFPGPGGKSVICFSRLDTTSAAFTVDLTRLHAGPGESFPERLREAVSYSDCPVRACTWTAVEHVVEFINRTEPSQWAALLPSDMPTTDARERPRWFLTVATSAHDYRDLVLKDARPHLPAQD